MRIRAIKLDLRKSSRIVFVIGTERITIGRQVNTECGSSVDVAIQLL